MAGVAPCWRRDAEESHCLRVPSARVAQITAGNKTAHLQRYATCAGLVTPAPIAGTVGDNMGATIVKNWCDAPEIHPSQIRVGDIIGTLQETSLRYTVKLISTPQKTPRKWTFFGRDDRGTDHANVFGEDDLVRRYAKAS